MRINSMLDPTFKAKKTTQPFKFGMYKDTRSMMDYAKPKTVKLASLVQR